MGRTAALALLPLGFLAALLLVPTAALLHQAGSLDLGLLWSDAHLRSRFGWSLLQALVTCIGTLALGVPIAWVIARMEFPGRTALLRVVMLPFMVPTLVAAMGVLAWLGPRGLLGEWLSATLGLDLEESPVLLLYGNLFFNLCLVVRAGVDALEHVSASHLAAARTLGATPWRAFWRIEWPGMRPWLASAMSLVFLYCFSGFGLALVLGGQRWATVEVEIYTLVAHELALDEAGALALWTVATSAVLALGYAALERALGRPARGDPLPRRRVHTPMQGLAVAAATAITALFAVAPLLALVMHALQGGTAAWSVLLEDEVLAAVGRTLGFTAVAVAGATVLGLLHGLAARRSTVLRAAAFLPLVISPVIVSFGLLLAYPLASASLPMMLAAYTLLATPFVARAVAAALDAVPPSLALAARSLGATPWRVFWRVTLPVIRPALRRGMAFAAAATLGEFAATLFLGRPEWATITTTLYQRLGRPGADNLAAAMVLALLLLVLATAALWLIEGPRARRPADDPARLRAAPL